MPIKKCTLPGGGQGWQWGEGKCFPTRKQAEAQAGPHYVLDDFGRELLFTSKKAAENYMNDEIDHLRPYWVLVVR